MKTAVILVSILLCVTTSAVGQGASSKIVNIQVPTAVHGSTFPITGSGFVMGNMASWHVEGSDFTFADFWDDYTAIIQVCTVGKKCTLPAIGISQGWPWYQLPTCLTNTCTVWRDGQFVVNASFIAPDPGDQWGLEIEVPAEISGSITAEYYQGDHRLTWPVWNVAWNGKGTAHIGVSGPFYGEVVITGYYFAYSGNATAQPFLSSVRTPGSQPTGVAIDEQYIYESEQGAFGTINQMDPLSGNVVRSFLSPSASGFDGRSKPSDLTLVDDHLFMTDVGSSGAGAVYEIDPAANMVVESFPLPFRGGALAADKGRLFVGDLDGNQVLVTDHTGNAIRSFATTFKPAGLVFDQNDNLLWLVDRSSERKIHQITTRGTLLRTCAGPWNPYGPYLYEYAVEPVNGLGGIGLRNSSLYVAEVGGYAGWWHSDPEPGTISVADSRALACSPELPTRVRLDVKPGSFPSVVNVKSNGVLPIAVLSTEHFDATQIDPMSVRFGDTGTEAMPRNWSLADVNGDGRTDLEFKFNTQETGIACDTTLDSVMGKTFDGKGFRGTDSVKVIGCK